MATVRKIIHIDMDAFYASIEMRDDPSLVGHPVIVGGSPSSRGVVATCNYEARRYGIHSAMPSSHAYRLCPHAIFLRARFAVYREVSQQIMSIMRDFTPVVEPLSLDEAYLDVSDSLLHQGSATLIARDIKQRIVDELRLTASAGVSYNKFLAKLASGLNKPDGLTVLRPQDGLAFIHNLPIGDFYGIGRATETKMKALGIHHGADLYQRSEAELVQHFGKAGHWYYGLARGEDPRPVRAHRERKSLGSETTFAEDLHDVNQMCSELDKLTAELLPKLLERGWLAHTVTVKIKYADFEQITRARSFPQPIDQLETLLPHIHDLLLKTDVDLRPVRLLGVTFSSLIMRQKDDERQRLLPGF